MVVRLLHVVRPAVGGMAGHIHMVCTGLDSSLYCVTVASPATNALLPGIHHLPMPIADQISPLNDFRVWKTLRHLVRKKEYDVFHAHGLKAALLASLACRTKGGPPLVFTLHNSLPRRRSGRPGQLQDALLRWIFRPAAQIVVVSNAQARDITERGLVAHNKVVYIPNGIVLEKFVAGAQRRQCRHELQLADDDIVILMVGRMITAKGVDDLLSAAQILQEHSALKFVLAGDGPDLSRFTSAASIAGLNNVRFLGYRNDIPALLQAADLFVLPSLSEGMPLTVLEAMAAARPVIATQVGGLPELVQNGITGILVTPRNPHDLAEAIHKLAVNPQMQATMGKAGRKRVEEHFTDTRMLHQLNEVYVNLFS